MRTNPLLLAFSLLAWTGSAMPNAVPLVIRVRVSAPGSTAERVEQKVTIPVERELHAVPGLASVASCSQEGLSTVELSFNSRPSSEDKNAVARAVSKVVAQMRPWALVQSISMEEPALR